MTVGPLAVDVVRGRRLSLLFWTLGIAATVGLIVASYGTIEGQAAFDEQIADMPEAVKAMLGLDTGLPLTSPAGYLNSQLFANMLPLLLTIFGIGIGTQIVAGHEGEGLLDLLLVTPIRRRRLALERLAAAFVLLSGLGAVAALVLVVTSPATSLLDPVAVGAVSGTGLVAATASSVALAGIHLAVAFAVGAATGRRGIAVAAGSAVAAGGFLVFSLGAISSATEPFRSLSPWYWFLRRNALGDGFSAVIGPLAGSVAVIVVLVVVGVVLFERRDVG